MNQLTHDPEGQALAKIYSLLIKKANEKKQQAQKKVMAEGTATTIQGNNSSELERNRHEPV